MTPQTASITSEVFETRQLLAATPIAGLSDEFDDAATLNDWQRINEVEGWNADQLDTYDIDTTQPGRMVQVPHSSSWYQDYRGVLSFKDVSGDFVVTTEIHLGDRDDIGGSDADDIPGDSLYSLAGLMIRTPRDIANPETDWFAGSRADDGTNNGENYVFLSAGYTQGENQFALEVKTTRNSNSQLEITGLGQEADVVRVQIARIGDSVIALYQLPGEEWQVHRRYSRPDMPENLQVGFVTYTDWQKVSGSDPFTQNSTVITGAAAEQINPQVTASPDLVAGFEYARFVSPDVPDTLAGADLTDPGAVSDGEVLSFLGDEANIAESAAVDPTGEDDAADPSEQSDPTNEADPTDDSDPADTPIDIPADNPNAPEMAVGMNLSQLTDWSQSWVFRDAFKMARPWGSRYFNPTNYEQPWGGELVRDENGWITSLTDSVTDDGGPLLQRAVSILFSEGGNPAGQYTMIWEGEGDLWVSAAAVDEGVLADGRNYRVLDVADDQTLHFQIRETNPDDYIRNIQLFMPDYNGESLIMDNWQPGDDESPFHPLFLERLEPFDTIRFMQWAHVNEDGRPVLTEDHLRPASYMTQATAGSLGDVNGVSVEYMVQLANDLGANPWFNMPHQANDDYVRAYAEYVRDNIDPEVTVHVEWANEAWNWAPEYQAYPWIQDQLELPENAGLNMFDIWAREARRDFEIWHEVFTGQEDRIVRVAAANLATPWVAEQLLSRMEGQFDALSTTSYAGFGGEMAASLPDDATEDDIIDTLLEVSVPWSLSMQQVHMDIAAEYSEQLGRDIPFLTYEGGSHLDGFGTQHQSLVDSAADNPRMYEVYQTLLHGMNQIGVGMHTQYVFTGSGEPGPWGDFGMLHDMDMPLDAAHDYRALIDFVGGDLAAPNVEVAIEATDASAHELGDAAVFTVSRTGLTLDDLTVNYTVGGTATSGVDYESLSGSVLIPAGEHSAEITITPLQDSMVSGDEGAETVTLTLSLSPGFAESPYEIDPASTADTATIADNEFLTIDDQGVISGEALQIDLPVEVNGLAASYEATVVENIAANVNNEHGLYVFADDFGQNWGGYNEKWVMGNGGYYYIAPSGDVYQWGGSFDDSSLLASLTADFYADPTLLTEAEAIAVEADVADSTLTIAPPAGFSGEFHVRLASSAGGVSADQTFAVSVTNPAPQIAAIDDQILIAGHSQTIGLGISGGQSLSISVQVDGSLAQELVEEFNLRTIPGVDDYALDWGGQNEKWLQGDGWFFLLPDGTFSEWGGSFESSTVLAEFSTDVYDDPQLLLNGQAAGISAEIVNGELLISSTGETGSFGVTVIVSNGAESASESFGVHVTNTDPELEIVDQTATAGVPLEIELPTTDADGHELSYTVEILGNELAALDAEHGFWSEGEYWTNYLGQNERWIRDAANHWFYLLPNGELHRWEGSFDSSPLVATLDPEVYADPSLLTDPAPPPVEVSIHSDGTLTIIADAGFTGEVQLRVTVSDGISDVSAEFAVFVTPMDTDDTDAVFAALDLDAM